MFQQFHFSVFIKRKNTNSKRYLHAMFTAALFICNNHCTETTQVPSVNEWMILLFVMRMKPEGFVLSEISHRKTNTLVLLIYKALKKKLQRTDWCLSETKGWGVGEMGDFIKI